MRVSIYLEPFKTNGEKRRPVRVVTLVKIPKNVDLKSGLPDGIFSNQKSNLGQILEGLALEDVGIFYGPFDIFYDHLV
jgi:ribosomal protein L14E/L6E/L27E